MWRPSGEFTQTYEAEMALVQTRLKGLGLATLLVAAALAPFYLGRYLFLLNTIGIFALASIGLNILTGYAGQISMGTAAFMAVGAYLSATLIKHAPFPLPTLLAGAAAALLGLVVGLPSLRLKGLYLAMATLAFQLVTEYAIIHIVGGTGGVIVDAITIGPLRFNSEGKNYYLILILLIAGTLFAANLARTHVGLAFLAIRDKDYAAPVLGVNLLRYKTAAFALSAFYAGVAGSLWAHYVGIITPEHFTLIQSIDFLVMVVIGGLGTTWGPILGTAFLLGTSQLLRIYTPQVTVYLPWFAAWATPMKEILFGVLIILFLILEPGGLEALCRKIKRFSELWPFAY
ncbi:MAG: branched-chain amino acid ABC transporter permease [candidate division NC10 bacterium]|nr:branched-chain amino acid ABC transporter permease [candidate division NC10 bacterium]